MSGCFAVLLELLAMNNRRRSSPKPFFCYCSYEEYVPVAKRRAAEEKKYRELLGRVSDQKVSQLFDAIFIICH